MLQSGANMPKPGWFEWLTIAAIVLGPVLALLAQRALDRLREKKKQRVGLYLVLMSTRAQPLSPAHVQALNSIDVVFNRRRKDKAIRAAWEKWLAHAVTPATTPSGAPTLGWGERLNDLKVELYQAIGAQVGYRFDIDHLKRQTYTPIAHGEAEMEQVQLRQKLLKVLTDEGVKIKVEDQPVKIVPEKLPF